MSLNHIPSSVSHVHVDPGMLLEDDLQNDRGPVTFPTPVVVLCFPPHDYLVNRC